MENIKRKTVPYHLILLAIGSWIIPIIGFVFSIYGLFLTKRYQNEYKKITKLSKFLFITGFIIQISILLSILLFKKYQI